MRKLTMTLAAILATASLAQAADLAELDTDADGVLSMEEFVAGHAEVDAEIFADIDTNEDGMIDPSEYEAATAEDGVLANN
ncbi:calcium-binding protein [Neptunicoccus cionae]|uniref:calcium-binding protein n=1 Tax=Neptunicoccus cionae TaxID=2035344 RepID=UPI000C75DDA8|nr:calcium-binding protein [Amylibacter cionae]PLS20098.1 calcium-binding protein [Amylibacter cionae]